jgi:hypothetical protein
MYYKKNNLLLEKNLSEIVFMKMSLFVRTAFITLLLVVFLPACSGSGVAQPTPEPVKVKVLSMPYITFAPFFIAQDEGYFAEQGLEVEFVQFDGLSTAIPALAQGEIDVVSGHIRASIFSAITGGVCKSNRLCRYSHPCSQIAARKRRFEIACPTCRSQSLGGSDEL